MNLKDVLDLAINSKKFIEEVFQTCEKENASSGDYTQNASSGDSAQNASSGDYTQNASSGDYAQNASSGYNAQNASSGDYTQNASSGDSAKNASSGDSAQNASSGDSAQNASSGDYTQNASSGDSAQNASSGDYTQNASSGDYTQNASSGDYTQNASSGDYTQNASSGDYTQNASSGNYAQNASSGNYVVEESTGKKSVTANIGYCGIVKSKKGCWITLAEYRKNKKNIFEVYYVKTEYVDGKNIKENVFYCLYDKQFREFIEIDGIKSAIISKKGNVYKVWNFEYNNISFLIKDNEFYSHGKTIKEAKESLIYKMTTQDTSEYEKMKLDIKLDFKEIVKMYRAITGACASGCQYFVETNNIKLKKYTIREIIELTKNQYGNEKLKEFFKEK